MSPSLVWSSATRWASSPPLLEPPGADFFWMWTQAVMMMKALVTKTYIQNGGSRCPHPGQVLSQLHKRGGMTVLTSVRALEPACHFLCHPQQVPPPPPGSGFPNRKGDPGSSDH